MVFSSILFLFYFLPIVFILYFAVPKKWKNAILFVVSMLFYSWGEPIYVSIMLFSTVFDYVNGLLVDKMDRRGKHKGKKAVLIISIIINLGILGFFKYTDFLIGNINSIFDAGIKTLNLALPIGISFYTFQTMSYVIDVYRKDAPVQRNIISFGAYIALFPQLIAGPIVRYNTIAGQLNSRKHSYEKISSGIFRFTTGLAKKVLIANNIGMLFDTVIATPANEMSVLLAWLGVIAFALQIYFDFSGYSDMAIGLGRMFGFEFDENFNYPYISKSITEFWRRWHISLGTWFREYIYIPLGGNRVKTHRAFFNLLAVWFVTGLWHGASWNFVIWGLYFWIFILMEKAFMLNFLKKVPAIFSHIYATMIVLIGWAIFAIDDMSTMGTYLGYMFGKISFVNSQFLYYVKSYLLVLVVAVVASLPFARNMVNRLDEHPKWYVIKPILIFAGLFICIAYLVDSSYNPFLYFRF